MIRRRRQGQFWIIHAGLKSLIADLAGMNSMFTLFANPYAIKRTSGIEKAKTILVNYQNSDEAQRAALKVISGELKASAENYRWPLVRVIKMVQESFRSSLNFHFF
jgi:hypothetical protein